MESVFSSKLHTNYVPSDAELEEIRLLLVAPEERVASMDRKMEEMRTAMKTLERQRWELSEVIEAHRALMSPIRRLPQDILREIFIYCLPTTHNAVMSNEEAPVLLTQVCSHWRLTALTTPRLWSSVHLPIAIPPRNQADEFDVEAFDKARVEGLRTWLQLSGACPLSISVSSGHAQTITPSSVRSLMDTLIAHSSRWENIKIVLPAGSPVWPLIMEISAADLPKLRNIAMEVRHDGWGIAAGHLELWNNGCTSVGLLEAQSLQEIDLLDAHANLVSMSVPWHQITTLKIQFSDFRTTGISMESALQILRHSPNLKTCALQLNETVWQVGVDSDSPAHLPALTDLSISEGTRADASLFFRRLDVPALRHVAYQKLKVSTQPGDGATPSPTALPTLLARAHNVESLLLDTSSLTSTDVLQYLSMTPQLKRLSFDVNDHPSWPRSRTSWIYGMYSPRLNRDTAVLTDTLLRGLMPNEDNASFLCPLLEVFESAEGYLSENELLNFVRARTDSNTPTFVPLEQRCRLKRVDVWFSEPAQINLKELLATQIVGGKLILNANYPIETPLHKSYSAWDGLPRIATVGRGHTEVRPAARRISARRGGGYW
ncbi:hypothetical protein BDQ12DRAFT_736136 [Crucibulum laeve]|uniref:Uncharacterized protein n=1 Tax=Crucibulum laeve TaxID=68775 RepID=A0A5C3LY26_9AGAR|nr:hypothetical protein BDQ12DRAFT_736136 [Crucibulum laeve]